MKSNYTPRKLNISLGEISQKHPLRSAPPEYKSDQEFAKILRRWAYMSEGEIKAEAPIIPPRRIRQLIEYINGNVLGLPLQNLKTIIRMRITEENFRRMFSLWLDTYDNKEINSLLSAIVQDHPEIPPAVFKASRLTSDVFLDVLKSDNIPIAVGKRCVLLRGQVESFKRALQEYKVSPESSLGKACIENYYCYCDKSAYLRTKDQDLKRIVSRYNENQIHLYLRNFLSLLDIQEFKNFYLVGKYLIERHTDVSGTNRFQKFFNAYPQNLVIKYRRWLDYITIRDSFRNNLSDERLIFWSDYVPYTEDIHMAMTSSSLILKFDQYVIVEFTEQTMGALYVYEKADFERRIRHRTRTMKNSELRSYLYNSPYVERIIHNGNWQGRTRRYLMRNRITK